MFGFDVHDSLPGQVDRNSGMRVEMGLSYLLRDLGHTDDLCLVRCTSGYREPQCQTTKGLSSLLAVLAGYKAVNRHWHPVSWMKGANAELQALVALVPSL